MTAHIPNESALAQLYSVRNYQGQFPQPIAATNAPAKLKSITASDGGVSVEMTDKGTTQIFTVSKLDGPGLERLSALDRATVQLALAGMNRDRGAA